MPVICWQELGQEGSPCDMAVQGHGLHCWKRTLTCGSGFRSEPAVGLVQGLEERHCEACWLKVEVAAENWKCCL